MSGRARAVPGGSASELDMVAAAARRLAALLAAGLTPRQATQHAAVDPQTLPDGGAWGLLAATWSVAADSGAPLAATLERFASGVERAAALRRELDVAFAGPAATARLVGVLPAVGLLFGLCLGFDTPHALFATVPGWLCLACGGGLMVAARRWSRRMLDAATPRDVAPGLGLELVAVAMSGGTSLARARSLAEVSLAAHAPDLPDEGRRADAARLEEVLALAQGSGIPVAGLLRAEAERRRAESDAAGRGGAARVAVRLMLPLAVCVLPAFMLLGVVPVFVALFSSTDIGLT